MAAAARLLPGLALPPLGTLARGAAGRAPAPDTAGGVLLGGVVGGLGGSSGVWRSSEALWAKKHMGRSQASPLEQKQVRNLRQQGRGGGVGQCTACGHSTAADVANCRF